MQAPVWKLDCVTLGGVNRPRLDSVTLEIPIGMTAVVGHSGAGKTSLLNLLVGFERPGRGRVIGTMPQQPGELSVFWVPQDDGLWPHLSVREHLQFVSRGMDGAASRIDELLARFDLSDLADREPDGLSQGERSRLSVARALASEARVLVMDEPLVHVDPARVGGYRQAVVDFCRSRDISLVLASHSPGVVLANADHVICLRAGRLMFAGPVDELYYRPSSQELAEFLGPVNWFSPQEAGVWIGEANIGTRCLRPEQLSIAGCEQGPLIVESTQFAGSFAEVEVRHETSGQRRRLYHRPPKNLLRSGDRVRLNVLLLLLATLMQSGCDGPVGAEIPVSSTRYWQLPTDGPKIPTPRKLTVGPDDSLYILDDAGRVLVYKLDGKLDRKWNMPESSVGNPEAVLVLRDGRIAVADTHYHRLVFFDAAGKVLDIRGSYGTEPGEYIYPVALAEDDEENLYVCEYGGNDRVQKYSRDGKLQLQFGTHGVDEGQFQRPSGIVWHEGKIYVADAFNNRIQVFSDEGEYLSSLGSTGDEINLRYPYDLCLDPNNRLLVVEYEAGRVSIIDLDGKMHGHFGSTGYSDRQFSTPWGLSVDSHHTIYVADTGNRRVVAIERATVD